ncbi:DUF3224 domain-containing protein [Streptomyces sp. CoH27]|uniref:DUF3224 domain-containing protein n=1 Tax=Streptomyces sp. CoH27 TaxID=2875763 RepID=UPI001CD6A79B|nr:DUF3224 domain-containing protein [Streptomyces sp. CoH27]
MRASGTFKVEEFTPADVRLPEPVVETAAAVGVATMRKRYEGEVVGVSGTLFSTAFDQATATGTYVALESFEGTLQGRAGTFNFAHSATTVGPDRDSGAELFVIVPGSGTGELTGIRGEGGIAIDTDGTHRIWFDYEVGA